MSHAIDEKERTVIAVRRVCLVSALQPSKQTTEKKQELLDIQVQTLVSHFLAFLSLIRSKLSISIPFNFLLVQIHS
jgi:hypothetical protein